MATRRGMVGRPWGVGRRSRRVVLGLGASAALAAGAFAIGSPSLGNGWFYDDLSFIRGYSGSELRSTLSGPFDPDRWQTPAYRPALTFLVDLRYRLLGESASRQRLFNIVALIVAMIVLGGAFWGLGIPLAVCFAAAAIELTAQDSAYFLAWNTDGYNAVQGIIFGLAVAGLVAALRPRRGRRLLLCCSLLLWIIALLIKEQAIALLPTLVLVPVLGRALSDPEKLSASAVRGWARDLWRDAELRIYFGLAVAAVVVDLLLRAAFVSGAPGPGPRSVIQLARQVVYLIPLAGLGDGSAVDVTRGAVYAIVTVALLALVITAPGRLAQYASGPCPARLRAVAVFAAVACAGSLTFALVTTGSDKNFFPLYFYGLFLASSIGMVLGLLWRDRRRRAVAIGVLVCATLASMYSSVRASVDIQRAMSPWSVQALAVNYEVIYGHNHPELTIPTARRDQIVQQLREVGIDGPLPGNNAFAVLYCHAHRLGPAPPGQRVPRIPSAYAFGDDGYPADWPRPGGAGNGGHPRCGAG